MSGMTAELIDAMDGVVDATTPEPAPSEPVVEPAPDTPPVDATPAATPAPGTDTPPAEPAPAEPAPGDQQVSVFDQMKAMLRQQRMENAEMRNRLLHLESAKATPVPEPAAPTPAPEQQFRLLYDGDGNEVKVPIASEKPAAPTPAPEKKPEPTRYDQLKGELDNINTAKGAVLETLYEVMVESPKYPDAEQVLQEQYFEDLYEALATERMKETKAPFEEALLEARVAVWRQPNPYRYMYGVIKKYHPAFAKQVAPAAQKPAGEPQTPPVGKPKEPPVVPSSLADMGSPSAEGQAPGWTASKLDGMSETELNSVPQDVIDKWLRNELP